MVEVFDREIVGLALGNMRLRWRWIIAVPEGVGGRMRSKLISVRNNLKV
jgi:hypothetical protein